MSAFSRFKGRGNDYTEKLREKAKGKQKNDYNDDRIWRCTAGKDGTGSAIIRFLPEPDVDYEKFGEDASPFVTLYKHGFQENGKWYINNCPTTIGEECPVCNANTTLIETTGMSFNDLTDKHPVKIKVRNRKRKVNLYANILVVDDPAKPENNGKVFLFEYGIAIQRILTSAMNPEFEDETPVNPFDPFDGCNLKFRMHKEDGNTKYTKSVWMKPSQLAETEEEMERIAKKMYSLQDIIAEDKFKGYSELENMLKRTMGADEKPASRETVAEDTPVREEAKESKLPGMGDTVNDLDDELAGLLDD